MFATHFSLSVLARETCPCKRTYAIAKCLMLRALVDARNKPIV